jgi:hypothetical protein
MLPTRVCKKPNSRESLTMRRTPPDDIKDLLRAEVGFGCPVKGCRLPFLEFHHFDPPWRERNHHDPDGMVALCVEHHKKADRGVFSKTQLKGFKGSRTSAEEIRGKFEWAGPKQLIRIGGVYLNPYPGLVAIYPGFPPGSLDFATGDSGLLELSFQLRTPNGRMLADMRKNMIIADPAGFDNLTVNASGTKIKAWVTGQDVVLELETSRLDLEQLGSILEDDWRRYRSFVDKQSRENPRFRDFAYIPGQRDATGIRTMRTLIDVNYVGEQISPAESIEAHREYVISSVKRLAVSGYFEDDGIPFLNVRQFKTASPAGPISITGGVNIGQMGQGFSCIFAGTGLAPA